VLRLLDQGINFFNSGRYFEAHEAWEDLWREERGQLRFLYQGLVQAAVALHHLSQSNATGARSQIVKSLHKLDQYPPAAAGIDLDRLRQDLRQILANMEVERSVPPQTVRIHRLQSNPVMLESDGTP